ncbi:MAG: hypothetical protein JNG83_03815 [Opitutaceae bacterium]|nr:hypothetical protein [Opitutaceae bacterium]
MNLPSSFRPAAASVAFACLVLNAPAEPASESSAPPAVQDRLVLNGIVFAGGRGLASVSDPAQSRTSWFAENEVVSGLRVRRITVDSVLLLDPATRREFTLRLAGVRSGAEKEAGGGDEAHGKAWINSTANPMLHFPQPLPLDLQRRWAALPASEKQAIIDLYLRHGWRLVSAEVVGGAATFAWENIYEAERREKLRAGAARFEALLSPEQLRLWRASQSRQPILAVDGRITPEQMQEVAARRAATQAFHDSLDAAQAAALEASRDFTQGQWQD